MLPFAIVGTIYWFVEVLFFTPTTPRGKLPPLDYIYARAFFNSLFCMKSRQLKDNDKDVVPLISADAVNILFPLDKLWDYDTAITNAIDKDCTDPTVASYLTKTPLEKEEMKNALVIASNTTTTTTKKQDTIQLHEKDKALITKHMQRINTIPLTISPSYYLVPAFNMDASVQTFMYFPLSFWSAATLTTTDITTFFPVPRGAQFFFETSIINIRTAVCYLDGS